MPVSDYMALALSHPVHGYYRAREPFGVDGDFVTAPEISQMFGELVGVWAADWWQRAGAPDDVLLAELGPGRGTLMADALRAAQALPAFAGALQVHLVETSPRLRQAQAARLGHGVRWHNDLGTLPAAPMVLIANEFFDALPVRQFVRTDRGWCERCIVADEDTLRFAVTPDPVAPALFPAAYGNASLGAIAELAPARDAVAAAIATRITEHGGVALIIDYGYRIRSAGDTLQAVRAHRYCDPLAEPGMADLTAHVDFTALAESAQRAGARVHGPTDQGAFLRALGIEARAARLKHKADPAQAAGIDRALARLTASGEMGELFKVLAIGSPLGPIPAGFST